MSTLKDAVEWTRSTGESPVVIYHRLEHLLAKEEMREFLSDATDVTFANWGALLCLTSGRIYISVGDLGGVLDKPFTKVFHTEKTNEDIVEQAQALAKDNAKFLAK